MTQLLISSGVVGAVIGVIGVSLNEFIKWFLQRRGAAEDRQEAREDRTLANAERLESISEALSATNSILVDVTEKLHALEFSNRVVLLDRIKWLGTNYLNDGDVSYEDRANLHAMHKAYHDYLGGNGDLDLLMKLVDKLPLKTKEE